MLWLQGEDELLDALRETCSNKEIEAVFSKLGFNRTTNAIQKRSKRLGIRFRDLGIPSLVGFDQETIAAVRRVLQEREECLASLAPAKPLTPSEKGKRTTTHNKILSDLHSELLEIRESVPKVCSLQLSQIKGGRSLVIQISDTHFGMLVHDYETSLVTFNMEIAKKRLLRTVTLAKEAFSEEIEEVVLVMNGDHIDGEEIFKGQAFETETHAAGQVREAVKAHWHLIRLAREEFGVPVRVITCRGNHGRTIGAQETNWDNILFLQLEILADLLGDTGIQIKNRYGEFNAFEVQGWRGLARHIAPAQDHTASGKAKVTGWYLIHDADFICSGHWHRWGVSSVLSRPVFRNGSLPGGNNFGESCGAYDEPVQLAWTVTADQLPPQTLVPLRVAT